MHADWEHFDFGADIGKLGCGASLSTALEQAALRLTAVLPESAAVRPRDVLPTRRAAADRGMVRRVMAQLLSGAGPIPVLIDLSHKACKSRQRRVDGGLRTLHLHHKAAPRAPSPCRRTCPKNCGRMAGRRGSTVRWSPAPMFRRAPRSAKAWPVPRPATAPSTR